MLHLPDMLNILKKYHLTPVRISWHVLFWTAFVGAHTLFYGYADGSYAEEFAFVIRYLPFKMLITYFTLYITIPNFLLTKKYIKAFFVFVISIAVGTLVQQTSEYFILAPILNPNWTETHYLFYPSKIFRTFLGMYPVVIIAAFIKLAKHWYEKDRQTQELKQQKLEAELNFLKSQIHPHFLFNTLNNLYALTLKKSDDAPEVVMKLSELLSFMLYEGSATAISLEKELKLIENYIELEKIRYDERLDIQFKRQGEFKSKQIPPMLLMPFVENAFKHGASNEIEETEIHIEIKVQENTLDFSVENSKVENEPSERYGYQKGVGLINVRRRLELLYNGYYTLDIHENETHYHISLNLKLDKLRQE
ncbi:MAG: histidine kinase [Gracilimonas sp.]|nr:histidine kinase [Gracilimonas sp.]